MILGRSKTEVDRLLGRGALARNIVGLDGEKSYGHAVGDFEFVVGYLDGVARYWAAKRRRGPLVPFTSSEMASLLALEAPAGLWKTEERGGPAPAARTTKPVRRQSARPPSLSFLLTERDPKIKDRIVREVLGFAPGGAPYAFFFLPVTEGGRPMLVTEWAVQKALG
jgi:hypothetical protein